MYKSVLNLKLEDSRQGRKIEGEKKIKFAKKSTTIRIIFCRIWMDYFNLVQFFKKVQTFFLKYFWGYLKKNLIINF